MLRVFVALGKQMPKNKAMVEDTENVAKLLAKYNCTMVQGGARTGLMGTVLTEFQKYSDQLVLIVPEAHKADLEGIVNKENHIVEGEADRLKITINTCDLIVVLPGGTGTMAELNYYNETRKSGEHNARLVMINSKGFYNPLFKFIKHQTKCGFMKKEHFKFEVINSASQLEPIIKQLIAEKQAKIQAKEISKIKKVAKKSTAKSSAKKVEPKPEVKKVELKPKKVASKAKEKVEPKKVEVKKAEPKPEVKTQVKKASKAIAKKPTSKAKAKTSGVKVDVKEKAEPKQPVQKVAENAKNEVKKTVAIKTVKVEKVAKSKTSNKPKSTKKPEAKKLDVVKAKVDNKLATKKVATKSSKVSTPKTESKPVGAKKATSTKTVTKAKKAKASK